MIYSITVLILGIVWLIKETHFLKVRLPYGKANNETLLLAGYPAMLALPYKPLLLLDTVHYKPSTFTALEMPKLEGEIIIICAEVK